MNRTANPHLVLKQLLDQHDLEEFWQQLLAFEAKDPKQFPQLLTAGWPDNQSLLYRICLFPGLSQAFVNSFQHRYPELTGKLKQFHRRILHARDPLKFPIFWGTQRFIPLPEPTLFPPHPQPSFFLWRWIKRGLGYLLSASFLRSSAQEHERDRCHFNKEVSRETDLVQGDKLYSRHFEVPAADGIGVLHTAEISSDRDFSCDKPWILYLTTAGGFTMSHVDILAAENFDLNKYNVAAFNVRGMKLSSGWYADTNEVLEDVILQINRLLDKGLPPHRIILAGHCYGGGLVTAVASYFHSRGITFGLFNDRSFGELDEVTEGFLETINTKTGHKTTLLGEFLAFIASPIVKFFFWLTDFNLPATQSYANFPEDRKAHICLRASKAERNKSPDDNMLAHRITLHKKMKPLFKDKNGQPVISPEQKTKRRQAKFIYEPDPQWCQRHGCKPEEERLDGHVVPLSFLRQSYGKQDGKTYFSEFADRVTARPYR